jgi:hypothetical protein
VSEVNANVLYPSRHRIAKVIRPIVERAGVSFNEVFDGQGARRHDVVAARHAALLKARLTFPDARPTHLARVFGVHHATVNFALAGRPKSDRLVAAINDLQQEA